MKKMSKLLSLLLVVTVAFGLFGSIAVVAEDAGSIVADITLIDGSVGIGNLVNNSYLSYDRGQYNKTPNSPLEIDDDGFAKIVFNHQLYSGCGDDAYLGAFPVASDGKFYGICREGFTYEISGIAKTSDDTMSLYIYSNASLDTDGDGNYDKDSIFCYNELISGENESPVSFSVKFTNYDREGSSMPAKVGVRVYSSNTKNTSGYVGVKDLVIKQLDTTLYDELDISAATGAVVTDMEVGSEAQLITKANISQYGTALIPVTRGSGVVYETSDARVATVNENGVVTAIGGGTATITAKLYDKNDSSKYLASNEFTVTVAGNVEPTVSATTITPGYNVAYKVNGVDKTAPYSVIVYGKFTGNVSKYGFKFSAPANGFENEDLEASLNNEGVYAIRVVADDIESDTFTFVPYAVTDSGTVTGVVTTAEVAK